MSLPSCLTQSPRRVRVVSEEINMDARRTSHEFRYTRRYPWVRMKIAQ